MANVSGGKKRGCILIKLKYFVWTLQIKNAPTSRFKVAFAFWIDISPNEEKKGLEEPRDEPQRLVSPGWNPLTFATHPLSRPGQAACQCAGFQAGPQMKKNTLNLSVAGWRKGAAPSPPLCTQPRPLRPQHGHAKSQPLLYWKKSASVSFLHQRTPWFPIKFSLRSVPVAARCQHSVAGRSF